MYNELEESLQEEFKGLPDYKGKFNKAYSSAVDIVGKDNADKIESAVRALLLSELGEYIKSKTKNTRGKWLRFIVNLVKRK